MKAINFPRYGSADVLQLIETEKPTPSEHQVLVKVYACGANPLDWRRMRATPVLVHLTEGFTRPRNPRLGADVAGRVEAIGSKVTQFKVGDEVFGEIGAGGFAEYALTEEKNLVLKPAGISFEQAAAVPVAALTALQGLRKGDIERRRQVLVNGASGGVGSFAVQIAKSFGAEVTGVCSTRNLELVRSIGAEHVIDYTREDFSKQGQRYDLIYDAVGNYGYFALRRALKPEGAAVIAGFTTLGRLFGNMLLGMIVPSSQNRSVGSMDTAQMNQDDLRFIGELMVAGKVRSVIDRCYPLDETAEALRYLETGRARGKVIISIAAD